MSAPAGSGESQGDASPTVPEVDPSQYALLSAALDTYGAPNGYPAYGGNLQQVPYGMGGPCDVLPWQELYMGASAWGYPGYPQMAYPGAMGYQDGMGYSGQQPYQQHQQKGRRSKAGSGDGRERTTSGISATSAGRKSSGEAFGPGSTSPQPPGPVTHTTVMFRNIPNKYTRDMLVTQLEDIELKGKFDFVYMPIDFKHQCNVGYAFINFRTIEACETFMSSFENFDINNTLNSRKVAEVTPARVQGLVDNVQRLRNSPVMLELASHTEWMPLVFDESGDHLPFPEPERPLAPIKPRKKSS